MGREDPLEKGMATHSCLKNPMDRGAWWATVHGSQRVTDFSESLLVYLFAFVCHSAKETKQQKNNQQMKSPLDS